MSADWIRMRTDLYRDPKVIAMADHLMQPQSRLARYVNQFCQRGMAVTRNVTRNAVVGGLVAVWGVLRHRGQRVGDDLLVPGCSDAVLDDISDMPGFGEAMCEVGWAEETDDGVILPKFFGEMNAEPIKSNAAERQKRYRDRRRNGDDNASRNGDVTRDVTVTGEKRREEKSKDTPIPPTGESVKSAKKPRDEHRHFAAFWSAYPRKEARTNAARAFAKLNPDDALLAVLLESITRQQRFGCLQPNVTGDGRSTIPHPASWLNGRRWEDQPPGQAPPALPPKPPPVPMPPPPPPAWEHPDFKGFSRDATRILLAKREAKEREAREQAERDKLQPHAEVATDAAGI